MPWHVPQYYLDAGERATTDELKVMFLEALPAALAGGGIVDFCDVVPSMNQHVLVPCEYVYYENIFIQNVKELCPHSIDIQLTVMRRVSGSTRSLIEQQIDDFCKFLTALDLGRVFLVRLFDDNAAEGSEGSVQFFFEDESDLMMLAMLTSA
jgi:hypothetical protein